MDTNVTSEHLPRGWHKTFYTLWIGSFITGMGYSMTMPFISLFINELGHFSRLQLNLYSGLAFAMTFISQAIVSPYWGSLADRKGRKLMCMRAVGCDGDHHLFNRFVNQRLDDHRPALFTGGLFWLHQQRHGADGR